MIQFIFEVHIKPGYSAEEYANAWLEASRILQQAPGARGTRLHRKLGDPNVLLAIASWDSKAQRDAMEADTPAAVRDIIATQADHVEIKVLGEFEAPEWQVIPGGLEHSAL